LARAEKELEEAEKDKKFPTCYIAVMRKKEEAQRKEPEVRRKAEEEARRKETIKDMVVVRWFDEGESFEDLWTWRKYSFNGGPMPLPPPGSFC
jgi:hypothetical protein